MTMAFKMNNKNKDYRWWKDHAYDFVQCGIPEALVSDQHMFWSVLQDGLWDQYDPPPWDSNMITDQEAKRLLALLVKYFGQNSNMQLVTRLEMRFGLREDFAEKTAYEPDQIR